MLDYTKHGHGKNIVFLLHGWLTDHRVYDDLLSHLNEEEYTWILVDFRGYGSSMHLSGEFSYLECAQDLMSLAYHLSYSQFSLVAHSSSSFVALYLAAHFPKMIASLTLISPLSPLAVGATPAKRKEITTLPFKKDRLKYKLMLQTAFRHTFTWYNKQLKIVESCSSANTKAMTVDSLLDSDLSYCVEKLTLRPFIMLGQFDSAAYTEESICRGFNLCQQGYMMVICDAAGHFPTLENPISTAAFLHLSLQEVANIGH